LRKSVVTLTQESQLIVNSDNLSKNSKENLSKKSIENVMEKKAAESSGPSDNEAHKTVSEKKYLQLKNE